MPHATRRELSRLRVEDSRAQAKREEVHQALDDLHRHAYRYRKAKHDLKMTEERLEAHRQSHPDEAGASCHDVAVFIFLLCLPGGALALDAFLLGGVAEFLVRSAFSEPSPVLVHSAKILVAGLVIVCELGIAALICCAEDDASDTGQTRELWFFRGIGLGIPVAIAATTVGTNWAVGMSLSDSDRVPGYYIPVMTALATIAFALHLAIAFGGGPAREAKSWALYKIKERLLLSKKDDDTDHGFGSGGSLGQVFRQYARLLEEAGIKAGPFEKEVARVVNEIYPGAIPEPSGPSPTEAFDTEPGGGLSPEPGDGSARSRDGEVSAP